MIRSPDYIGGDGIAVIEWAERINLDDLKVTTVNINYISDEEREIIIETNEHRNNLQE
jgi:tRNA A37 threonylcarbamoyladenosine biosynthesis protein TsaE